MQSTFEYYLDQRNFQHDGPGREVASITNLGLGRDWMGLLGSAREIVDSGVSSADDYGDEEVLATEAYNAKEKAYEEDYSGYTDPYVRVFAFGRSTRGDIDSATQRTGSDFNSMSGTAGMSFRVNRSAHLGFHASYATTDVDYDRTDTDADVSSVTVGPYFSAQLGRLVLNGWFGYGFDSYDMERRIIFPGVDREAKSDTRGYHVVASMGADYFVTKEDFLFAPTARVTYLHNQVNEFSESGADALNLRVDEYDTTTFTTELGALFGYQFKTHWGAITPEARVRWTHEFVEDDTHVESAFLSGAGTQFEVESSGLNRDAAHLGAGLRVNVGEKFESWVEYDAILGSDETAHGVGAGIGIRF